MHVATLSMLLTTICGPCAAQEAAITVNVLVVNFDPVLKTEGNVRLHEWANWQDPRELAEGYISDIKQASGGFVQYRVSEWIDADVYPTKNDGFAYDEATYLACFRREREWHQPDGVDYDWVIDQYGAIDKINNGDADEVWMFGAPYFGYYESRMVGPTAYFCNGPALITEAAERNFVVMGFNYERGVGEMLEDLGHRTESIMRNVYGRWSADVALEEQNTWEQFVRIDRDYPGESACGNTHFSPNSGKDYDWGNPRPVMSTCDDWLNYPNLTGEKREVDCSDWGGGEIRAHHVWWLTRLPKAPGRAPDGKLANWWKYVIDLNRYPESRAEYAAE